MIEVQQIICPACHKATPFRLNARFCQHCRHDIVLNNDAPSDHHRYYITRVVKEGGQGAVYEGIDAEGKVYAIKEMLDRVSDPRERKEALDRFNAEAGLLQKLSHPRIPRVYSHFNDEGKHYLTMDFIRGEDLEELVEREGPLPEERVLAWADQICDVLAYLHDNGLIYRDMKPSNVMIERDTGSVKLIDFGIAKHFKPTERGTQIGTPGYAPPEQYQGLATPASDIYALGATLHHLLTGRDPTDEAPFSFPPARNLNPHISRRTSDALAKALAMKPEDRWATVAEFRAMLRPLAAAQPQQVRVAPAPAARPAAAAQVGAAPAIGTGVPSGRTAATPPAQAAQPARRASVTPPLIGPAQPAVPARPQPARPAQPQPARRPRRGAGGLVGGLLRGLATLLLAFALLLGGIGAGLYFLAPNLLYDTLPWVEQVLPRPAQEPPVLMTRAYEVEVEVTLPAESSESEIIAQLREEYVRRAKASLGDATLVNLSTVSTVGGFERIAEAGGQLTVRALMRGFVQAP